MGSNRFRGFNIHYYLDTLPSLAPLAITWKHMMFFELSFFGNTVVQFVFYKFYGISYQSHVVMMCYNARNVSIQYI